MGYALLIIDMINEFVKGNLRVKGAKEIIPVIRRLLDTARERGIAVIYANDSHKPTDPEIQLWGRHAMEGTEASEVVEELKPAEGDYLVKKTTYDAFFGTEMEELLRKLSVDVVCITGVVTSICCQHTAASAFFRGFKVIVVSDATADLDEETHKKALEYMRKIYGARILTSEELMKEWKSTAKR